MKRLSDLTINAVEEGLLWQALPKDSILFPYWLNETAIAETIIRTQIQRNRTQPSFDMTGDYRYIKVDLYMVMYDSLLADEPYGFFDGDDLPPPKLWVNYQDGELMAIIPPAFETWLRFILGETGFNSVEWCDKQTVETKNSDNFQKNKSGLFSKFLKKFF